MLENRLLKILIIRKNTSNRACYNPISQRVLHSCLTLLQCLHVLHSCLMLLQCLQVLHSCLMLLQCLHVLHSCLMLLQCLHVLHSCLMLLQCLHVFHSIPYAAAMPKCYSFMPNSIAMYTASCTYNIHIV